MSHLVLNTENGRIIFFITYNLAFLLALAIFIVRNRAHGNSLPNTLLTAASGTLFFVLGMHFFSISPEEIKGFFQGQGLSLHYEKNLLGGVAGLLVGVLLAARCLRLKKGVLDDFALALPLGMVIHRIGCLATGCCFGRQADLPWSVCYTSGSQAFHEHPGNMLSPAGIPVSLPVHPVQLYEAMLGLFIVVIVWKMQSRFRAPGNLFRFSMILYCLMWFGCEFFRDQAGVYVAGQMFLGLRMIQWYLLAVILIFALFLGIREIMFSHDPGQKPVPGKYSLQRIILFMGFLSLLFLAVRNRIELMDKLLICLMLVPGVLVSCWYLYRSVTIPQYRLLLIAIFLSGPLFMSQVIAPPKKGEHVKYTEIGITGMWNGFSNTVQKAIGSMEDCNGHMSYDFGTSEDHRHNVWLGGIQFSSNTVRSNFKTNAFYFNLFAGGDQETGIGKQFDQLKLMVGINPGWRFDWRAFGLRTGIWLGAFQMAGIPNDFQNGGLSVARIAGFQSPKKNKKGDYSGNFQELYFFPQIGLRAGPADICYLNLHLAEVNPATAAPILFQAGIGSGLGKSNGSSVEAGISTIGVYLHGNILIRNQFLVSAYVSNNLGIPVCNTYDNTCVSIGLHYRFGKKTGNKTTN